MNVRKTVDYSAMFASLDALMAANLSQMKLYCEIGRLVQAGTDGTDQCGGAFGSSSRLDGQSVLY